MQFLCAHCHTPLPEGARTCDRCGAPAHAPGLGGGQAPAGYAVYEDRWRGFSTVRPEDWAVLYPKATSVCFRSPGGEAWLDLMTLPPNPVVDATQQARLLLGVWPDAEVRSAGGASREQAALAFRTPHLEGRVLVRLAPSGCVAVLGRRSLGAPVDVDTPMRRLLQALGPTRPIPKEPFVGPEQAFRLQRPQGWRVDATIVPAGNVRQPICRVYADPSGQALLACEPDAQLFVDVPDAEPAPAEEGFFAKVGRWAQQAGNALSVPPGHLPMPFAGLGPMVERHFLPRIQAALPGAEVVSLDDRGERADLRVAYPNGAHCVFRLEGRRMPDAMVPHRWLGSIACWYQAPAEVFDAFEPIFRGIADSVQTNPQWREREFARARAQAQALHQSHMQMAQMRHQQNMQTIHQQGAASRAAFDTSQSVLDIQMQGWSDRQAMTDHGHQQTIDAVREVTPYAAPGGSAVVEASAHFDRVWSDPQGNLYGGDWSIEVPPDWNQLKPLD